MNFSRTIPLIGALAFVAGFWTACSIGFDPSDADLQFSCTNDQDCIAPKICRSGVCGSPTGMANCDDADGDGFGVGVVDDCPKCRDEGNCEVDCDDMDASVNPGAIESCDGKDNNCNTEVDEPVPCESSGDCADEQPYLQSCNAGVCEYKAPNQLADPACATPAACVGGTREDKPEICF